ncbi:MAG: cobyric acid synthase [Telmatospirillum sp.]|nr:cobyric acid synthase [Telmatospirillum sp.]
MLQGTGSDVGKSLVVAGLCRLARRRGLSVAPFKPQNMSNNAAVTPDGGEIGRAQALQARAAGLAPNRHMNPVLLKPQSETGAQVVVQGRVEGVARAGDYQALKPALLPRVLDSFRILGEGRDLLVVEGAGSVAEVNLRSRDIANMGFAEAADVPVILVGDIDRGGVIAALVGSHALLPEAERRRIRGWIINKFRGDVALFDPAVQTIRDRTGWPSLGILPWFVEAALLPAEDAASLGPGSGTAGKGDRPIRVAVPCLSRIANFDDLDPLSAEPDVEVTFIAPGRPLPRDADLILLPGSKATIADLTFLRQQGWDIDLAAHVRQGGHVLGLCAGYQMLGTRVADPDGIEGPPGAVAGLGLLDIATVMAGEKTLRQTTGKALCANGGGETVRGYEMHMGVTDGPDRSRPVLEIDGRPDGAISADGRVMGCYLHGLFAEDGFRRAFLAGLRPGRTGTLAYEATVDRVLDRLADHLEHHLDVDAILRIAGLG